eukprot:1159801-Pelagomonas_calceolata.AAC.1
MARKPASCNHDLDRRLSKAFLPWPHSLYSLDVFFADGGVTHLCTYNADFIHKLHRGVQAVKIHQGRAQGQAPLLA